MRDDVSPGADHPITEDLEAVRHARARRLGYGTLIGVALVVAWGGWSAYDRYADAAATLARINGVPTVRTMVVKPNGEPKHLSLPGTMEPFDQATIYARATGYIASRNADFGSKVKAGDVLAVIAAPDLDQQRAQGKAQVAQMEAALGQSKAEETLQEATNNRTRTLVAEGWETRQRGDTDQLTLEADKAAVRSAEANLDAQKANLSRLDQLADFEKVTAPFDGVVTDRQVDVGSLVSADANSGTPLFSIARADTLRVQVYVPQEAVLGLHDGGEARISVPEIPGRVFTGTVSRMSSALSAGTRTMLTQIDVKDPEGVLRAGLYCTVTFTLPRATAGITLPSQAIIFNREGLSVAVVADGKVRLQKIELAQDDGATVDVKTGLQPGDQVILSPPVNLNEGMAVTVAAS
jgi:RND family efflux transporter MFP subunit